MNARIGFVGNGENDCGTPDSAVGLGMINQFGCDYGTFHGTAGSADPKTTSCGGTGGAGGNVQRAFAFIYVR